MLKFAVGLLSVLAVNCTPDDYSAVTRVPSPGSGSGSNQSGTGNDDIPPDAASGETGTGTGTGPGTTTADAAVPAPPPPDAAPPITVVPALDCSTITPPAGFTRENVDGFSQLFNRLGPSYRCQDVPNTGGSLCIVPPRRDGYMTVRFQVPADTTGLSGLDFRWSESQYVDGNGVYGPIQQRGYNISISTCPGDFREPTPGSTSTQGDPTFVQGCRYLRYFNGNLSDPQGIIAPFSGTGNDFVCPLRAGGVYYFNMIPANPMGGGYVPGEGCGDPDVERCAIQLQVGPTI